MARLHPMHINPTQPSSLRSTHAEPDVSPAQSSRQPPDVSTPPSRVSSASGSAPRGRPPGANPPAQDVSASAAIAATTRAVVDGFDPPFSIDVDENARATRRQPLRLNRLVLGGGGKKAAVFEGVVRALEASGQRAHLREFGGTSAGAVASAYLACGVNADRFTHLSNNMRIAWLGKQDRPLRESVDSPPTGLVRDLWFLLRNLGSDGRNFRKRVDFETRTAVLSRIDASGRGHDPEVDRIRSKLVRQQRLDELADRALQAPLSGVESQELKSLESEHSELRRKVDQLAKLLRDGPAAGTSQAAAIDALERDIAAIAIGHLTLGDLNTLAGKVDGIGDYYAVATAGYSGIDVEGVVQQPLVFSSKNADMRHLELSITVLASCAFPGVLATVSMPLPHDLADASARTVVTDGGLMQTIPAMELLDADAGHVESLIVPLDEPVLHKVVHGIDGTRDLLDKAEGIAQHLSHDLRTLRAGVKYACDTFARTPLGDSVVVARLSSPGSDRHFGSTLSGFRDLPPRHRQLLQDQACQDVLRHLEGRTGDRVFASTYHLIYSLEPNALAALDASPGQLAQEVQHVKAMKARLEAVEKEIAAEAGATAQAAAAMQAGAAKLEREACVERHLNEMQHLLPAGSREESAFAAFVAGSDSPRIQRLLDILRERALVGPAGSLVHACIREDEARCAKRWNATVAKTFLYPSLNRFGQSEASKQAIRQTIERSSQAVSRQEIMAALHDLTERLKAMSHKGWRNDRHIIEKAAAFMTRQNNVAAPVDAPELVPVAQNVGRRT